MEIYLTISQDIFEYPEIWAEQKMDHVGHTANQPKNDCKRKRPCF